MRTLAGPSRAAAALLLTALLLSGCAGTPLSYGTFTYPFAMKRLREQEKQYGPTLHTRLADLDQLADQADRLSTTEKQQVSEQLALGLRNEENALLRSRMVRTLAKYDTSAALGGLRTAMQDADPQVRADLCRAWVERGGPEAREALVEILRSDTNVDVRIAATRALGELGDPQTMEALATALDDTDPALQFRAVQSLKQISGRDYGSDLDAWRRLARGEDPGPPARPRLVEQIRNWF